MSLRTFVDSAGREWQAYDVVPREEERRHYDRRSEESHLDEAEERRDHDRRLTVGGRSERLGVAGWLVFENGDDRRRLTPIPEDWNRAEDSKLETYLRSARQVKTTAGRGRFGQTPK